ncbi:MAG TPA: hypothetical protein VIV40_36990 [Kofleriaceae bacterium]
MIRYSWLVLALATACTDDGPSGGGVDGTTHVESYWLPAMAIPTLDVLFVIDDTTAMASHQTALANLPAELLAALEGATGIPASYHFGVVTTDVASGGNLRRSSSFSDAFVSHDSTFSGPANNYQGTLASALTSVWPSSAASTASNQPLATMRAALDHNPANPGFLRDDAYLGVVTISATDDASTDPVDAYVSYLKSVKTDPARVIVSGVLDLAGPRLTTFHAQFPNRNDTQSIDATDYIGALELFTRLYTTSLGYACNKQPADLDPNTPGAQYDCSFVWIENGVEHGLPQCKGGDTAGCWEIVTSDPVICVDPGLRAHLQTRGFTASTSSYGDPVHPEVRGQCIVN